MYTPTMGYSLFMVILIGLGVWTTVSGVRRGRVILTAAGVILTIGTAFFFWFMGFWGEWLWFDALGYSQRFWEVLVVRVLAGGIGLVFSVGLVFLLTIGFSSKKKLMRQAALVLAALMGGNWGVSNWETILRCLHAAPTELQNTIFGISEFALLHGIFSPYLESCCHPGD